MVQIHSPRPFFSSLAIVGLLMARCVHRSARCSKARPFKTERVGHPESQNQPLGVDVLEWYHPRFMLRQEEKSAKGLPPAAILQVLAIGLTLLIGCGETPTSARLKRGPRFLLDGSGRLASFRVYAPQPGHRIAAPFDAKSLVWHIQPTAGYFKGDRVHQLTVNLGTLPTGYAQIVPAGIIVPRLPSNVVYYFFAETTDAPPAGGFFYLSEDVPIEIAVPGLCESDVVGDVRPVKCGTNDPYVEPTDLEKFVHENQTTR